MKFTTNLFLIVIVLSTIYLNSCKSSDKPLEVDSIEDEARNWLKANELEFLQTYDPATNTVPTERLVAAQEYTKQLMQLESNNLNWTERGPNNIGGRVRAILVDKADPTGNTVIVGGVGGGIWRTTNFKSSATWTNVNNFLSNMAITSIAQHPTQHNIMYAGTGEGFAGVSELFNNSGQRGNGIFKSTNGGLTWTLLGNTAYSVNNNFGAVNKLVVANNGDVFAACSGYFCNRGGLYKSKDGGDTWSLAIANTQAVSSCAQALDCFAADVEIAGNGDIYATTKLASGGAGKVWKSSFATHGPNTGDLGTFVNITQNIGPVSDRIELAIAPNNPNRIYTVGETPTGSSDANGLYRSDDGGATWVSLPIPQATGNGSNYVFTRGQAFYNLILSVDPTNDDRVLVGGIDLFRSNDSGTTWQQISVWSSFQIPSPLTFSQVVHADQHELIYRSDGTVVCGNDGGIYEMSNVNGSGLVNYTTKNLGLNITQFYSVAAHPTQANYIMAGAQDNGTIRLNGAGLTGGTRILGGDGMMCYIDQTDGNYQIGSFVNLNYRISKNGGSSFSALTTSNGDNRGLFVNPGDYDDVENILYAADQPGSYMYFDMDDNPSVITQRSPAELVGRQVTAVKAIPQSSKNIFVGTRTSSGLPQIFKINNATDATPEVSLGTTFPGLSSGYISSIDVHPTNNLRILVVISNFGINNVWQSTDGGVSFSPLDGNLPDMPIRWGLFMPPNALLSSTTAEGGIVLATETGVWSTSNVNGNSTQWSPNNNGLANVSVRQIYFRKNDYSLFAGTHGRGVFSTTVPATTTRIVNNTNTKGFIANSWLVNNDMLNISTGNLSQIRNIKIELLNNNGQVVYSKATAYQTQQVSIGNLPKGVYVLRVYALNGRAYYTNRFIR